MADCRGRLGRVTLILSVLAVAGCAARPAPPPALDSDPLEAFNRRAHAANLAVDTAAYGPVSRAYGRTVPEPIRNGVMNLVNHVSLPAVAIQYALQGRPVAVTETFFRFGTNTVFGLGGLLDPAAEMGLGWRETNVDETLYRWGVPEGGYLELPIGGPGTERDWVGFGLDLAMDPAVYLTAGATAWTLTGMRGLELLHDRYKLDPAVQALLYESADSYTSQRISYLQNMRARLQGGTDLDVLEDPYADF